MEAAAKETRTLSDEDAKKNIYVGKPVSEIIRQESAPEATRGLNRHNVLAPPILRFSKTESEAGAKADDLLVQPGTQGNGLPDLPKHAREVAVIKFEGLPAKGIIMELKTQLQKYQSDLTFREHGVDGKVLIGDELLKFTGNLCSLKLDANRKGNIGLHMILQTGDRVTWLEFFTKLADEMGGKADPRVKEFISRYCDFGHLGGPAEVQVSPDLNFVQGCHKMVASNFAESQIEGLKGLKLALEFCACGDSLSRSFGTAIEKALDSAAGVLYSIVHYETYVY